MDPHLKTILDEIKGVSASVANLKASVSERIDGVERSLDDRLKRIEVAAGDVGDWKPKVDASIDDLRLELAAMRKTVNRVILDSTPAAGAGILATPGSAVALPSAGNKADGPDGHRVDFDHRESASEVVYTHTHSPVKGTPIEPPKPVIPPSSQFPWSSSDHASRGGSGPSSYSRVPKLQCPVFDGENPKLWIRHTVDYFELSQVDPSIWIKLSSL